MSSYIAVGIITITALEGKPPQPLPQQTWAVADWRLSASSEAFSFSSSCT
jgi:hypothetical protein